MNYRIQRLPIALPANWTAMLPPNRREQVLRLRSAQKQMESVAAYLLLCDMVGQEKPNLAGVVLQLSHYPNGKPYLTDFPEIHFNFSHCPVAVACAVSDARVGIDIEKIRPYKPLLAKRVLSDEELLAVEQSIDPAREFTKYWTKKEALLKLTGEGIRTDLKTVLQGAPVRFTVEEAEDYICTVAEDTKSVASTS